MRAKIDSNAYVIFHVKVFIASQAYCALQNGRSSRDINCIVDSSTLHSGKVNPARKKICICTAKQIAGEMTPDESKKTVSRTNVKRYFFAAQNRWFLFISFIIKNVILLLISVLKVVSKLRVLISVS